MAIRSRYMRYRNWSRHRNESSRLREFLVQQAARLGSTLNINFTRNTIADPDALNTGTAHGLTEGDGPLRMSASTALPGGLVAGRNYYARVVDVNDFRPATDQGLSDQVIPTDDGVGTLTLVRGSDENAIFHLLKRPGNTADMIRAAADVDAL